MYLTEVVVKDAAWLTRIGKKKISFPSRVSLLVGPNGSGKSSTLALLNEFIEHRDDSSRKSTCKARKARFETLFVDTEKTARSASYVGSMASIAMRFSSHGEAMKLIWKSIVQQKNPALFIIDEPEAGTDHSGLRELVRVVEKSEHQFIIATHHLLLWNIKDADLIVFGDDSEYPQKCMKEISQISRRFLEKRV